MSATTKKLGVIEVLIDMFGKNEVTQLSDELLESQERANSIMKKTNEVANVTSTKKSSGKAKKGGIVEQVDVKNISFPKEMIETYNRMNEEKER